MYIAIEWVKDPFSAEATQVPKFCLNILQEKVRLGMSKAGPNLFRKIPSGQGDY